MKKRTVLVVVALTLVLALVLSTVVQAANPESSRVRALIGFDPAVNEPAREALLAKFSGVVEMELPIIDGALILLPLPAVSGLAGEPAIRFVEMDQRVSAFPKPPWAGGPGGPDEEEPPPQVIPTGVDRVDAELSANTAYGIKVAVIDTGIDYTHPDLDGNYKGGYDYVNNDADPIDDNGHGTHVAGIIAAEDNDIGVVGVAPQAWLYAVKVLDRRGDGWLSDVIAGINWAAENDMDVANLSLGAKGQSQALHTAVVNATLAGVTLVVAAGNESDDAEGYVPATYDEVITVSAIADFDGQSGGLASSKYYGRGRFKTEQKDDAFAYFSNYGQDIDLAAPGVEIYSTSVKGKYETLSGTSMAAPHVAGAAALYIFTNAPSPDDVNGDGVDTVAEVVCQALRNAGWKQGDYEYFSSDQDIYPEPLLKVDAL